MECESAPGQGTTFRVFLPRNEALPPLEAAPTAPAASTDVRGDETILLVDDEIMVRMVAETLLKKGVMFAGIDIIGGWLSEVNITCPALLNPDRASLKGFDGIAKSVNANIP
jgi:hypothetical protein